MTLAPDHRTVADLGTPRPGWWEHVACRPRMDAIALRRACGSCPVSHDCLLAAVQEDDQATYRAGMFPEERNDWLATQGIVRVPSRRSNAVPRQTKRLAPISRGQGKHRPDLDSAELCRLHDEEGWTFQQLADRFQCARDTVVSRVRAHRRAVEAGQA